MSSPLDRAASTDAPTHRAPRRAGGSSTSLSSLPSRLVAPPPPPTLKPSSPDVQLDLSSAASASTAHTHASLRTANDAPRPRSVLPSSSNPRPTTSVIESSQLWKTSAAKRAEKSWALQTERALYSDAKFKKYLALVERTLASFDSVSEWADFISFLARLHKAIQAYPAYNVVPRKLIVAKRLAQCLNPALPSGVHQRALDVYHHILSVVGPDGLRRDLHVWTSGLLPFFQYASTSVKPTLLAIYETFYLPLHDDLRPLTRALQMALLPGLEEETSEYFDRTIRLLDRISDAVEPAYFLQNLWLTLITTPSVRLAALNYLTRRMPDLTQHDDPTLLVGKDLGLMVRGLAHALDDDLLLVRRNTLDILVTHLAVDEPLFRRFVKRPDQILLVRSALHVVLRKDLSLNRRLYTWLLGADETPAAQIAFLDENALDLVRSALAQGFHGASSLDTLERQKPYRIFVSLLDKWEIGQSLTRVLALDAFHAISLQVAKRQEEELVTTAKMLFEVIDPFLLYGRFLHAITQTMQSKQGSTEDGRSPLSLLCFIFKAFHIHDDETKHIHVPLLFAAVTQLLDQLLAHDQDKDGASTSQMLDALELLKLLITAMPSRVFVRIAEPGPANKGDSSASDAPDFWQRAHRLYTSSETDSQHAARHFVGFQDAASASALVELLSHVALQCGQRVGESGERAELFVRALDVFADLMRVLDGSEAADEIALVRADASSAPLRTHKLHWNADAWADSLMPFLQSVASFAQVERIVEVLISCCICRALDRPLVLDAPTRVDRIVAALLRYLSPAMAPYHVRAVELLWATNKVTRRSRLETALAHQLSHNDAAARAAALTAFGAYWRLSEDVSTDELRTPLLLVLDRLQASDADERQQAELWLRAHVRSYVKVVDPLVHMLVRNQPAQLAPATVNLDGISVVITHVEQPYNHELVVYALRTLAALVRFGGPGLVKALASTPLSASLSTATKQLVRAKDARWRRDLSGCGAGRVRRVDAHVSGGAARGAARGVVRYAACCRGGCHARPPPAHRHRAEPHRRAGARADRGAAGCRASWRDGGAESHAAHAAHAARSQDGRGSPAHRRLGGHPFAHRLDGTQRGRCTAAVARAPAGTAARADAGHAAARPLDAVESSHAAALVGLCAVHGAAVPAAGGGAAARAQRQRVRAARRGDARGERRICARTQQTHVWRRTRGGRARRTVQRARTGRAAARSPRRTHVHARHAAVEPGWHRRSHCVCIFGRDWAVGEGERRERARHPGLR